MPDPSPPESLRGIVAAFPLVVTNPLSFVNYGTATFLLVPIPSTPSEERAAMIDGFGVVPQQPAITVSESSRATISGLRVDTVEMDTSVVEL